MLSPSVAIPDLFAQRDLGDLGPNFLVFPCEPSSKTIWVIASNVDRYTPALNREMLEPPSQQSIALAFAPGEAFPSGETIEICAGGCGNLLIHCDALH
jgi:hypothetical protein